MAFCTFLIKEFERNKTAFISILFGFWFRGTSLCYTFLITRRARSTVPALLVFLFFALSTNNEFCAATVICEYGEAAGFRVLVKVQNILKYKHHLMFRPRRKEDDAQKVEFCDKEQDDIQAILHETLRAIVATKRRVPLTTAQWRLSVSLLLATYILNAFMKRHFPLSWNISSSVKLSIAMVCSHILLQFLSTVDNTKIFWWCLFLLCMYGYSKT